MSAQAVAQSTRSAPGTAAHALLWDPDARAIDRVADALRATGHRVHPVARRHMAWRCLTDDAPDVAVVGFCDTAGLDVVEQLRTRFDGPLVCYSATAGTQDRVAALTCGADDVVPSPLSFRELVLRVRAVLRRSQVAGDTRDAGAERVLVCGPLNVDTGSHRVKVDGRIASLTSVELALLVFLMRNPGVSFSRRELLRQVWGYEVGDTSTVSVHIRRVRRKIERDASRPTVIRTVWGSGYYLDPGAA